MKKILYVAVVSFLTVAGTMPSALAQEIKIGAVNAVKILENSPQADAARSKIEQEFAPRDRKLVEDQRRIKELEDRLMQDGAIMSETERNNLERQIVSMQRELKRNQDEFRDDLNFRRNEEFGRIQKTIIEAIQKVAIENGYDMVVGEGVIYASQKIDISDMVIEYLRQLHQAGG